MKLFHGIAYLALISTFLVATAGIPLTRHTCLESGQSHLVIDQDFACCDLEDATSGKETTSGGASECCRPDDVLMATDAMAGGASDCCEPGDVISDGDAMTGTAANCLEAENTACKLDSKSGTGSEHTGNQHKDCCMEQHHYLKTEQDYSKPSQTELPSVKILLVQATLGADHHMTQGHRPETGTYQTRPILHTDSLLSHGALLL